MDTLYYELSDWTIVDISYWFLILVAGILILWFILWFICRKIKRNIKQRLSEEFKSDLMKN